MVEPSLIARPFEFLQIDDAKLSRMPESLREELAAQNLPTMIIGICGGSEISEDIYELAYETGKLLGERNVITLTGGRGGVMEVASKGSKAAGGITMGILPSSSASEANRYVDIPIGTGWREGRNFLIPYVSDAIIAIDGGYGTLSEVALAQKLGKPVVVLGPPIVDFSEIERFFDPQKALERLLSII